MEWFLVDNLDNDIGICCGQLFYYVLCQRQTTDTTNKHNPEPKQIDAT